jgi:xanthine dehydrogenase accessory factor
MVVTAKHVYDTIGGGALEMEGINHARAMIAQGIDKLDDNERVSKRQFKLGPALSQCCGGSVTLQFDCHLESDFVLHVFGAGHVAQEVTRLALRLPCRAVIHDGREDWLARVQRIISDERYPAGNLSIQLICADVYQHVENLESGAYFLVMTHCHELDLEVVEAVLSRNDAAYCGLIASKSKAAKFRNRLQRKGFTEAEITTLTAPLGQGLTTGNTPMEVAIAGITDVLTVRCGS